MRNLYYRLKNNMRTVITILELFFFAWLLVLVGFYFYDQYYHPELSVAPPFVRAIATAFFIALAAAVIIIYIIYWIIALLGMKYEREYYSESCTDKEEEQRLINYWFFFKK